MTDAQIQAYLPSVATLVVVSISFLYNNSHITDLSTGLHKRIDNLNARIDRMDAQYARLESVIVRQAR